jgi:hypothetical protein
MISAKSFGKSPVDWDRNGVAYYHAEISQRCFGIIGLHCHSVFEDVDILWLSTKKHRRPCDRWLTKHFPSLDHLIAGFRKAFEQYRTEFCGEAMHTEMLKSLSGNTREAFLRDGWLPFVSISSVRINPDEEAIGFRCTSVYEEYNLFEHEIAIVIHQGKWEFGYAGDETHYFHDWSGPVPNYRLRFALKRFWDKVTGRRELFDDGDIEITDARGETILVLRGKP